MKVYVLIDRGQFAGVFATAELAQASHAHTYAHTHVTPTWRGDVHGVNLYMNPCGLGDATILRTSVCTGEATDALPLTAKD